MTRKKNEQWNYAGEFRVGGFQWVPEKRGAEGVQKAAPEVRLKLHHENEQRVLLGFLARLRGEVHVKVAPEDLDSWVGVGELGTVTFALASGEDGHGCVTIPLSARGGASKGARAALDELMALRSAMSHEGLGVATVELTAIQPDLPLEDGPELRAL